MGYNRRRWHIPPRREAQFVALDGEATDGVYTLIQDSEGGSLYNENGLPTADVLNWLVRRWVELDYPIYVGYGISYDVNQIIKDMPDEKIAGMFGKDSGPVEWKDFGLFYLPKKLFRIRTDSYSVTWYDVLTFFGCSFVKALEGHLPGHPLLEIIRQGKQGRQEFTKTNIDFIKAYNEAECKALVDLMNHIREMFYAEGFQISKWHGPGAVADYLLGIQGWNVKQDFTKENAEDIPIGLGDAWDRAYFGGRIETFTVGGIRDVYAYDIASAYPAACLTLPKLPRARKWQRKTYRTKRDVQSSIHSDSIGLYEVSWSLPNDSRIGPLPWRAKTGRIYFPKNGHGWYWKPEINAAISLYPNSIKVLSGWEAEPLGASVLCSNVPELYQKRLTLKRNKDPAQYAYKIALNTIYGKFACRTGKAPFHNLVWAGLITSQTRAKLLNVAAPYINDVLAFATDAIFSKRKLPHLHIGNDLGAWTEEHYPNFLALMSGFYQLGDKKVATRGMPNVFDWDDVLNDINYQGYSQVTMRHFVTHNLAINFPVAYGPKRLTFSDLTKTIDPFGAGSRIVPPFPSDKCFCEASVETQIMSVPNELSAPSSDSRALFIGNIDKIEEAEKDADLEEED